MVRERKNEKEEIKIDNGNIIQVENVA